MKPTIWQLLDVTARRMTPFILTLMLLVLSQTPMHIPGVARVVPLFTLMAVFHWGIYRPELMPAYAVFLIGILQDALTGMPLGINALVLLIVYGAVLMQQRFFMGKGFGVVWLGYVLVSAGAVFLTWFFMSAFSVTFVRSSAAIYQYVLSLGLYPFVAWLFLKWQRSFLE